MLGDGHAQFARRRLGGDGYAVMSDVGELGADGERSEVHAHAAGVTLRVFAAGFALGDWNGLGHDCFVSLLLGCAWNKSYGYITNMTLLLTSIVHTILSSGTYRTFDLT